jgi:hypothetical protein
MSMRNKEHATIKLIAVAMLSFLLIGVQAFGQSSSASLSGKVLDASKAVLPGATVTATNTSTGVTSTTLTNNVGSYSFPSLPPGTYKVTAEMPSFQTQAKTDVALGISGQARLDFELAVAVTGEVIEVVTSAQNVLIESSSSTGTVLQPQAVTQLPLVSNDVMDLINIMGGVVKSDNPIFSNSEQSFAGVSSGNINLQRDGITISEVRYTSGIVAPSRMNPELVGEFKMILSPVDAELGRGMGQVQILTKSGGSAYHGSAVWNIQNSALDANEFNNNKTNVKPSWRNLHNYTLSLGGPIRKNKSFFFVVWDQAISRSRTNINTAVLTNCARKGIFRYFTGWNNRNYVGGVTDTGGLTAIGRPVVGFNGVPLAPQFESTIARDSATKHSTITTYPTGVVDNPNTPADESIAASTFQFRNVFGPLTQAAQDAINLDPINCAYYDPYTDLGLDAAARPATNGYWENLAPSSTTPYRVLDTGYIPGFTAIMPEVNNWDAGDGLNTGGHRWVRGLTGSDTVFGSGEDNQRRNITVKIDHNFNDRHRMSGTYMFESNDGEDAYKSWPNGYSGAVIRKPQTFVISMTSTLRPTLLNEARFGMSRTFTHTQEPLNNVKTGKKMEAMLQQLLDTTNFPNYAGLPLVVGPGGAGMAFQTENYSPGPSNPYGSRGNLPATWGGTDNRWTSADTITWTKGNHSFKFGGELRLARSNQDGNGSAGFYGDSNTFPYAQGGTTQYSRPTNISTTTFPAMGGQAAYYLQYALESGNLGNFVGLLDYMSGSLGTVRQYYFVNSAKALTWNDASKGELTQKIDMRQREFNFFAKDDWKVNSNLTLNLGIRYEYYGIPWLDSGMTTGLAGGSNALFGVSGRSFDTWMSASPVNLGTDFQTRQTFVGPNSPNPSQMLFNKDLNNFGPAVGFAWQLPWFGKGKTTLRGGYQVSYMPIGNADAFVPTMGKVVGTSKNHQYDGSAAVNPYLSISNLENLVPTSQFLPSTVKPLAAIGIRDRSQTLSVYDPNLRNPYIQSLTLSLSRSITSNLTVDVRYVGTLSRKQIGTVNLNSANWRANGLLDALTAARSGGESALLNTMLNGTQTWDWGTFSMKTVGVNQTAGQFIRANYAANLANGDFSAVASSLATANFDTTFGANAGRGTIASGDNGWLLRATGMPENFIYANPQFATANWRGNLQHSNYHSLQAKVELRPTRGFSFTSTYTWSRNLGDSGTWTDPTNREADYTLLGSHRAHQINTYGSYDLPFGSNGFFFRNTSGAVKRIIEGWQLSWVLGMASGKPETLSSGTNHLYANGVPNFVGPEKYKDILTKGGKVTWDTAVGEGNYWGFDSLGRARFAREKDPQCSDGTVVASSLTSSCTLYALYDAVYVSDDPTDKNFKKVDLVNSTLVLAQPLPGQQGNFGRQMMNGIGLFSLDMTMGKSIQITEGKSITLRVDATNILNHPTPSNSTYAWNARFTQIYDPNTTLANAEDFGRISSKGQHRTWQAKIRFTF